MNKSQNASPFRGRVLEYAAGDQLPVVGPATHFFDFLTEDPERSLLKLKGDVRLFAETEFALSRCDFKCAHELFEKLPKTDQNLHQVIRLGVKIAIGLGDLRFLDSILKLMAQFRSSVGDDPNRRKLVELTEGWLAQWLWLPKGYPEWIVRFDYDGDVPKVWRHPTAYLGVMARLNAGQFESAYALAAMMMALDRTAWDPYVRLTDANAYLSMARAICCREIGRTDEMRKWLDEVIRRVAPHGILMPFLLFMSGSRKSPAEEILAEVAPKEVARYRALRRTYFANLIRARNHITGEKVTEALSLREFYLAMLLKRGFSYKELADRFGISVGRVKNLLLELYQKLHIHSRAQIKPLVW